MSTLGSDAREILVLVALPILVMFLAATAMADIVTTSHPGEVHAESRG